MALEIRVVPGDVDDLHEAGDEAFLGEDPAAVAVKIDEIIKAVSDGVQASLVGPAELSVEISGSVALKAEAGVKWMLFKLGGSTENKSTMKVILKTKLGAVAGATT